MFIKGPSLGGSLGATARMRSCSWVWVSVKSLQRLFVLKTMSRTQRATKVKKFVRTSLKSLRCRDIPLPARIASKGPKKANIIPLFSLRVFPINFLVCFKGFVHARTLIFGIQ